MSAATTRFARLGLRWARTPLVTRPCVSALTQWRFEGTEAAQQTFDPKIENLTEEISKLTLLEVADLVSSLKGKLNIADMPVAVGAVAAPAGGAGDAAAEEAAPVEEKTEFNVKLVKFDDKAKIKVIKEVRNILPDLKLAEAKKLVEGAPAVLKEGISKEEAEKIKAALTEVGAEVALE